MKLGKHCISSAFGVDLVSGGGLWLPRILLQNYGKLGISNLEMLLLIHLMSPVPSGSTQPQINEIAEYMNVAPEEIFALLGSLEAKGIIRKNGKALNFEGLFEKVLEIWGCQKAKAIEQHQQVESQGVTRKMSGTSRVVSNLYHCFEKEFGRPLSPMESTQIMEWYYGDKYSFELIVEALKRAVLRGVVNFKYVDSILRGWCKNNLKTVKAIIAYEEAFSQNKKGKGNGKGTSETEAADLDKKYNDIYL